MTAGPGIGEPHSTFGRLFMYSKDTLFTAQENFMTEAVAACIRSEPSPMLIALRGVASSEPPLTVPLEHATRVRVTTQVYVAGAGIVDAILTIGDEDRIVGEVWIEAKIASPEGHGQLDGYVKAALAASDKDGLSRDVVALSKYRLDPEVAWLDWRQVYVATSRTDDPYWQDLRLFMEETQVSDVALLPITDREAGSIADAGRMLAKASEVIRLVNREVARLWPTGMAWAAEGALLNHVGAVFRQSGRMVMEGNFIRYGAVDSDGTAYWYLALPSRGMRAGELETVVASARERGLGPDWEPRLHLGEFLVRTGRIAEHADPQAAVAWFRGGLVELSRSGLMDDIRTRSTPSPVDDAVPVPEESSQGL